MTVLAPLSQTASLLLTLLWFLGFIFLGGTLVCKCLSSEWKSASALAPPLLVGLLYADLMISRLNAFPDGIPYTDYVFLSLVNGLLGLSSVSLALKAYRT